MEGIEEVDLPKETVRPVGGDVYKSHQFDDDLPSANYNTGGEHAPISKKRGDIIPSAAYDMGGEKIPESLKKKRVIPSADYNMGSIPQRLDPREKEMEKAKKIVLEYLDAIINKNPLEQLFARDHLSDDQKEAIAALQSDTLDMQLRAYIAKRDMIQAQIKRLEEERDKYTTTSEALTADKKRLELEREAINAEIKKEKERLEAEREAIKGEIRNEQRKLDTLRQTGVQGVQKEIDEVTAQRDALLKTVKDLSNKYKEQTGLVQRMINGEDSSVEWATVLDNNPIYNTTYNTIDEYIKKLKEAYADFKGISLAESNKAFNQMAPGLSLLKDILLSYCNGNIKLHGSLRLCNCPQAVEIVHGIKLPVYTIDKRKLYNNDLDEIKYLDNNKFIYTIKAGLRYQTIAMEAVAKQQIAERQRDNLINALAPFIPKDFDLDSILKNSLNSNTKDSTLNIDTSGLGDRGK